MAKIEEASFVYLSLKEYNDVKNHEFYKGMAIMFLLFSILIFVVSLFVFFNNKTLNEEQVVYPNINQTTLRTIEL